MISHALLPVGDWEFLDSLYVSLDIPVDWPNYDYDEYVSQPEQDRFVFGRRYYDMDADSGWVAYVMLESGVPTRILHYVDHDWGSQEIVFRLASYTPLANMESS